MRRSEVSNAPRSLTQDEASAIYDVLVEHADARSDPDEKRVFVAYASKPELGNRVFVEWRFSGSLGFGGKLYFSGYEIPRVGCYAEDTTPERIETIKRVNGLLAAIFTEAGRLALAEHEARDA